MGRWRDGFFADTGPHAGLVAEAIDGILGGRRPTVKSIAGEARGSMRFRQAVLSGIAGASAWAGCVDAASRNWTPADSVGIRYVVSDSIFKQEPETPFPGDPIVFSPDGKHFLFRTFAGDLACDCNVEELLIFSVRDVLQALRNQQQVASGPFRRVVLRSQSLDSDHHPISAVRWYNDHVVILVGVNGSGPRGLFRLDIESGAFDRLTSLDEDVYTNGYFDAVTVGGGAILYDSVSRRPSELSLTYPIVNLDAVNPTEQADAFEKSVLTTHALSESRPQVTFRGVSADVDLLAEGRSISPDGQWAIVTTSFRSPPVTWMGYQRTYLGSAPIPARSWALFNLRTGEGRPLLDAPWGPFVLSISDSMAMPSVLWTADSKHIVVVNTALPLSDSAERRAMSYVARIDVDNSHPVALEPMEDKRNGTHVAGVHWSNDARLEITHASNNGASVDSTFYSVTSGGWTAKREHKTPGALREEPGRPAKEISVQVRQDANTPPTVVASNGIREVLLLEPDSALLDVWRAPVVDVHWIEDGGKRTITGGLMLPRVADPQHPPPLVIQNYSYSKKYFLPDGIASTVYAAQALAAEGFAVLQMDNTYYDYGDVVPKLSPAERELFVKRVDASVQMLAEKGLVDATRVGIVGFYIGGFLASYVLTHPGAVRLRAAVLGGPVGLYDFSDYLNNPGEISSLQYQYVGGSRFWDDKKTWLEHDFIFGANRATAPVLLVSGRSPGWRSVLATRNALAENRIPVSTFLVPQSTDAQLQRPREREAAMRETVNWMKFWLRPSAEHDSSSAENAHWREMQLNWESQNATADALR